MEHAIWIKRTGEEQYISIKKLKAEIIKGDPRQEKFVCPSERCRVKMITVFPRKIRRNGKEAHSDHFRAKPEPHTPNCGGDGGREEASDTFAGGETGAKPRHDMVKRGDYPTRYVKRFRQKRYVQDGRVGVGDGAPGQSGRGGRDGSKRGGDIHTSERETGHIRELAEAYENPPDDLSRMRLRLPQCPATNYADAFMDVGQAVDEKGIVEGHYIYKGVYLKHDFHANGGISITFTRSAGDGRKLGVWIKPELEPVAKREEVKGFLARAARDKSATFMCSVGFGDSKIGNTA